jgi:NAD(P)-dependent dehydrogenase (short-subunit alcohol dehydrogenase family)
VSTTPGSKVWLITDSSRGFGRRLAEAVLEHGDRLVATARHPEQLSDLVKQYWDNVRAVELDVTNAEQTRAAVFAAVEASGMSKSGVTKRPLIHLKLPECWRNTHA